MRAGVAGQLDTPDALLDAIGRLRELGYRELDAFTPYVIPELEEALDLRRDWSIPAVIWGFGFAGGGLAYLVQWVLNARSYPLDVGGRPPHAIPAFMINTFVTFVLVACTMGFLWFLYRANLGPPIRPLFDLEGFERASIDRFWVAVSADDPRFSYAQTTAHLRAAGASQVQWFGAREEGA
jgi:hypothetical protein